ncbi:MAG: hypothetical protein QF475_01175 [Candidatus Undinarchaeales archaeon]|jgi:hypothetical protein|nr:hypothetical protein [Candidatus Undinarchaeales archaeon]
MKEKTSILIIALLAVAVLGIAMHFRISPTGLASEGFVTANVAGTVAIDVTDTQINLSKNIDADEDASAYVATNATSAEIDSFANVSNQNWLNRTGAEARIIDPDNLSINNTGTVYANITFAANASPTTIFGVSGGNFWFKMTNGSEITAACEGIQAAAWTEYSTNTSDVCEELQTLDTTDVIDIWIKWQVPAAAIARVYNSTLTVSAAQSNWE